MRNTNITQNADMKTKHYIKYYNQIERVRERQKKDTQTHVHCKILLEKMKQKIRNEKEEVEKNIFI